MASAPLIIPNKEQAIMAPPPMDLQPMTAAQIRSGPLGIARILVGLFSTTDNRREPPAVVADAFNSKTKTRHLRLITVAVSHYCEKARWALDLVEADSSNPFYYTEDGHPPAFVAFASIAASTKGNSTPASATPMLVLDDDNETVLVKSDVILKHLLPFLYTDNIYMASTIQEFEDDLGERLGTAIRLYAYYRLLDKSKDYYSVLADMVCLNTSKVEKTLFTVMLSKGIDKGMRRAMKINDENAARSKETIRQVFAQISDRLESFGGGDYIMDTRAMKLGFTAVDLTFAALSYPFLRPACMEQNFFVDQDRFPDDVLAFMAELRATRAGQHALKMYELHRPVSAEGVVEFKSARRNRKPWKELAGFLAMGAAGVVLGLVMVAGRGKRR